MENTAKRRTEVLRIHLLRTIVAIALLSGTSASADTDWKTYPGTACQTNSSVIVYDGFGGICNLSTRTDAQITCAIDRDMAISRFPTHLRVSGRSGNPDQDMTCTFRNLRLNAADSGLAMAAFFADMPAIESNAATTIRTREFGLSDLDVPAEDFGALVLVCTLPESRFVQDHRQVHSCLYNYSVQESDGG